MNCFYDCEYCYLQGMYSSANIVVFINLEDIFREVERLLVDLKTMYLFVSYDTDLLAMENIMSFCEEWIRFCRKHVTLKIEIRTKSSNFKLISRIDIPSNVIFAWTISPENAIIKYENKTPSLNSRLKSSNLAVNLGCKVRLCFNPILFLNNWKEEYKNLIEKVFMEMDKEKILDVSVGTFRVSKDYLKKNEISKERALVLNFPYETFDGVSTYSKKISCDMLEYVNDLLLEYIPKKKIFIMEI